MSQREFEFFTGVHVHERIVNNLNEEQVANERIDSE